MLEALVDTIRAKQLDKECESELILAQVYQPLNLITSIIIVDEFSERLKRACLPVLPRENVWHVRKNTSDVKMDSTQFYI